MYYRRRMKSAETTSTPDAAAGAPTSTRHGVRPFPSPSPSPSPSLGTRFSCRGCHICPVFLVHLHFYCHTHHVPNSDYKHWYRVTGQFVKSFLFWFILGPCTLTAAAPWGSCVYRRCVWNVVFSCLCLCLCPSLARSLKFPLFLYLLSTIAPVFPRMFMGLHARYDEPPQSTPC